MKRLLSAVAIVLLVQASALAGGPEPTHLATTVQTNSATLQVSNTVTSDAVFYGYLDYVSLDLGGFATATVRVDLVTVAGRGSGPRRTLLTLTAATADGLYPIRQKVTSTAGTASTDAFGRIPLYNDKIVLEAYNALATNATTVDAYVFTVPFDLP